MIKLLHNSNFFTFQVFSFYHSMKKYVLVNEKYLMLSLLADKATLYCYYIALKADWHAILYMLYMKVI